MSHTEVHEPPGKHAIEVQLDPNNFIRDGGSCLAGSGNTCSYKCELQLATNGITTLFKLRPPIANWIAYNQEPAQPCVYKQDKWHAKSCHYPDDGDSVSLRNVGFYKSPDATVCPSVYYLL